MAKLEIKADKLDHLGGTKILVDGREIELLESVTLQLKHGEITRATIEFSVDDIKVDAEAMVILKAKLFEEDARPSWNTDSPYMNNKALNAVQEIICKQKKKYIRGCDITNKMVHEALKEMSYKQIMKLRSVGTKTADEVWLYKERLEKKYWANGEKKGEIED